MQKIMVDELVTIIGIDAMYSFSFHLKNKIILQFTGWFYMNGDFSFEIAGWQLERSSVIVKTVLSLVMISNSLILSLILRKSLCRLRFTALGKDVHQYIQSVALFK